MLYIYSYYKIIILCYKSRYLYLYNRYVIKHTYLRALGACRLALRFRKELDDTFVQLFSELSEQVELITPRLAALEARGRVLRDGIEEERKARIRVKMLSEGMLVAKGQGPVRTQGRPCVARSFV